MNNFIDWIIRTRPGWEGTVLVFLGTLLAFAIVFLMMALVLLFPPYSFPLIGVALAYFLITRWVMYKEETKDD